MVAGKPRGTVNLKRLMREAAQLGAGSPDDGQRIGISPRVYSEKQRYEKESDEEWPGFQPDGDNRQSMERFGVGRNKEQVAADLDRQAQCKAPSLMATSIVPSDRLVRQAWGEDMYDKLKPARLFRDLNEHRYRLEPDGRGDYTRIFNYSMEEEDVLYDGLDEFIKAHGDRAQFFILGDTNHDNATIQMKLYDPELLRHFAAQGVKHVFLEGHEYLQPLLKPLQQGGLSRNEFVRQGVSRALQHFQDTNMGKPYKGFKRQFAACLRDMATYIRAAGACGMEVHFMDGHEGGYFNGKGELCTRPDERLAIDKGIAARMKTLAGDQKGLVIYGAMHGAYKGTLDECLGFENVVRVNVHANLRQYQRGSFRNKYHIDYQPRYLYLVEEDKVIHAPENYARKRDIDDDPVQRLRDPEVRALAGRRTQQAENYQRRFQAQYQNGFTKLKTFIEREEDSLKEATDTIFKMVDTKKLPPEFLKFVTQNSDLDLKI